MDLQSAYNGASVLVTGHTGFKGSWLCEWLLGMGARVSGLALEPDTSPSLFHQLNLAERVQHHLSDIRDQQRLADLVAQIQPDYIFHLAAQPLVRRSYRQPLDTWQVNVMGTLHLLEAARKLEKRCAVVCVTTDKCYENPETALPFAEDDALGGHDPYSSSKAGAEIAIASWRRSFFPLDHPVAIASARAGNVIGGGDWAEDRIVPDAVRSLRRQQPIAVRSPAAVRPWQHVLEPLSGYLVLGHELYATASPDVSAARKAQVRSAFNFGPGHASNRTVSDLVTAILDNWSGEWVDQSDPDAPHEAHFLQLNTARAAQVLGWKPVWNFATTVRETVRWYRDETPDQADCIRRTRKQIETYCQSSSSPDS